MRILVTGGTGYLGTAIVAALARRGHAPVVFARSPDPASRVPAVRGDVTDAAALARAARDVDAVCHSAALVSIWERDRARFEAINVGGLRNALAAAKAAGHDRFVYTSSFLALPPAGRAAPLESNDNQRTNAQAAAVADAAARGGVPITRLYPGVIYGPSTLRGPIRQSDLVGQLIHGQRHSRMPMMIGGDRIWSFALLDDVADAHVSALEQGARGGAAYQLGGENLPQRRLYELVHDRTGARVPMPLPGWMARGVGAVDVARAYATGRAPLITPATVAIFEHDWPLDSARAQAELGYRITPLAKGLAELLD
jgi:farnesol dehydrogenase